MPVFKVTTRNYTNVNGVYVEKGLSVQVVTKSLSDPILSQGGQLVADAFMRVYGLDLKRAGCLNTMYLKSERIE